MEHVRQITAFDIRHNEAFAHTQHGTSVQSSLTKEVKGDRISTFCSNGEHRGMREMLSGVGSHRWTYSMGKLQHTPSERVS